MKRHRQRPVKIDFFFRPGYYWTDEQLARYHTEMEQIASDCFLQVPRYQCLTGSREDLKNNVITFARDNDGNALGFCSAVILDVGGYENILHLGLSCVKKHARQRGLTHYMASRLLMKYLFKTSMFKTIWVTNVACVLSSLGNVALHFEDVFPSPYGSHTPSRDHIRIAQAVDRDFRQPVAINKTAELDLDHFVFRNSVHQTVFQKSEKDTRYYHRDPELTQFYLSRMNFKNGDEIIQVARIGILSYPKYRIKMAFLSLLNLVRIPRRRVKAGLFSRKG
ncbi:MAG: hypothetical protein ABIJ31_13975 [Pseudomonadota bacterium]